MEDAYCVRENLLKLTWSQERAQDHCVDFVGAASGGPQHTSILNETEMAGRHAYWRSHIGPYYYHFFGCFDGHGGQDAANHCSRRLHENVRSIFADMSQTNMDSDCDSDYAAGDLNLRPATDLAAFDDGAAWSDAVSEDCCDVAPFVGGRVKVPKMSEVLVHAFRKTDDEFSCHPRAAVMGTTAVAALVGEHTVCVANCGDSKAVLYRGGLPVPLSVEHRPDRQDEMERVEKAGGKVMFWNGPRVMGILAMSRALGDLSLRPYVIPDPDVTVVARQQDDEFLILGSDGLWDVLSNSDVYSVVLRCFARARDRNLSAMDASRQAATALTRTALDRGSRDNITAIVVDLRQNVVP